MDTEMTFTKCQNRKLLKKEDRTMELKRVAEEMKELREAFEAFLNGNEEKIVNFLRTEEMTAEESLQKEVLFELLDHVHGICHVAEYMKKEIMREGILARNGAGEITFDGEILPMVKEIEVYIRDEDLEQEVWTKTFVGGVRKKYLVGLGKDLDVTGLKARMRG